MTIENINQLAIPGFLNSFQVESKSTYWQRNRTSILFILITFLQIAFSYLSFMEFADPDDSFLDSIAMTVDFGDIVQKSKGANVVEIDEVFGNEFVKDKVIDPNATEDPRISGATDAVVGGASLPVDLNPEIIPEYTAEARNAGIEGTVTLEMIVSDDGKVLRVRSVGRKLGNGLEQAAINAFKKKRYVPSKVEGKAITVKFYQPVRFTLVR